MNTNYNIYGWDKLSKTLLVIAIVLAFFRTGKLIGIILVVYAFWRSRSKDIYKRNEECIQFERFIQNIKEIFTSYNGKGYSFKSKINNFKDKIKERKYFIITKCPNCYQKLRLPKNKGNILVTCPTCSHKFKLKT